MSRDRTRAIAYYLPQFHPIPENDQWWGKGFTEWTNVAKAQPLFRGHRQPVVPADLGFYDLRVPETRRAQAQMAREHGIEGFCYWHYWFGAGRRLLERPFSEVLRSGEPDFPFCLGWANETWSGVWHGASDKVLMEQTYPGPADEELHFRLVVEAFHDRRYLTVEGKPIFYVYRPRKLPEPLRFTDHWRELALKEGLPGVHFVGEDENPDWNPWDPKAHGFDAVVTHAPGVIISRMKSKLTAKRPFARLINREVRNDPIVFDYRDYVAHSLTEFPHQDFYPCVLVNWDNTPRSGLRGVVLADARPELFREQLLGAMKQVAARPAERRIVFLKSWNEWAEGNHLEPDLHRGRAYLEVCREVLSG